MYYKQASFGATFAQDDFGWLKAERFTQPSVEKAKLESSVGLADISHVTKLSLKSPKIAEEVPSWSANPEKLRIGTSFFVPSSLGIGDVLCGVLTHDEALLVTDTSSKEVVSKHIVDKNSGILTDVSSVMSALYMLGPKSRDVFSKLTEFNVNEEDFQNLRIAQAPIRHVQSTVVRMDLAGVLGYQIYFERAFGEYLWEIIFAAGKEFGIIPVGGTALQMLGWRW